MEDPANREGNTTEQLREVLLQALTGRGAHVLVRDALDGLDWRQAAARGDGGPHSIFKILAHLNYWHAFALRWIDGDKPEDPEHAALTWPGAEAPATEQEWLDAVAAFAGGLDELERRARETDLFADRQGKTTLEILQLIASHNSYHLGQVTWIRRGIGAWPPPAGGATW